MWDFPGQGSNPSGNSGPHHSHSGPEPHRQPMPQLAATLNPQPTEQGQRWNLHPLRDDVRSLTTQATPRRPSFLSLLPNAHSLRHLVSFLIDSLRNDMVHRRPQWEDHSGGTETKNTDPISRDLRIQSQAETPSPNNVRSVFKSFVSTLQHIFLPVSAVCWAWCSVLEQ